MDTTQSSNPLASKFPSYIGTSILALPPNLETSISKRSSKTSSPTASWGSTYSLFALLMYLTSSSLLCIASIASNLAQSYHISISTTRLAKGGSTHLLGGTVQVIFVSSPFPIVCKKKFTPIPLGADPLLS
jgi:hypothetical protein